MWIDLNKPQQIQVLEQTGTAKGLPAFVIEKDWWVTAVLKAVFQSKYAGSCIFKGGTSLSKAYQLIDRFSEDIDLIIDRHLLGFDELKTRSQIKKLRKASGGFITNDFRAELVLQLEQLGISKELYEIKYNPHIDDTSDPNTLEIYYRSVVPIQNHYIQQRVLLEVGARSLTEPHESKPIISFIDRQYAALPFAKPGFDVQVVLPTRTFLEKVLLLHEEFSKPADKIRTHRLTRHFYDLDKMMAAGYGEQAISDDELFFTLVTHRKLTNTVRGIDYSNHAKGKLKILPPGEVCLEWESDYKTMRENMIPGDSLKWEDLLKQIKIIENKLNKL